MSPSDDSRRHPLELRVHPPLVFVLATGMTLGVDRLTPSTWQVNAGPLAAMLESNAFEALRWTWMAAAVGLATWAIASFKRAGTTTDPADPASASALVRTGPFRWMRNPMYLALTCILAAIAWGTPSPAAWLSWLVLPAYLTRFQILPEERMLTARFGPEYLDYRRRTGRWLPRLF